VASEPLADVEGLGVTVTVTVVCTNGGTFLHARSLFWGQSQRQTIGLGGGTLSQSQIHGNVTGPLARAVETCVAWGGALSFLFFLLLFCVRKLSVMSVEGPTPHYIQRFQPNC
jgi:hypothetical protein